MKIYFANWLIDTDDYSDLQLEDLLEEAEEAVLRIEKEIELREDENG